MKETLNHDVIVSYGDGSSDRFEITFSPGRNALIPISEVTLGYRCVTNPKVKLEILGDTLAYVGDGQLVFLDEEMYEALSYKLTTEEGTEIYLNKKKGVYKIEDNNGNVITVDKNGYHSKDGKSITLKRDSEDRVVSATDPAGNITNYAYDAAGDLVSVTDAAGRTVSFAYDKKHNLMSMTDPMGIAVARNEYDDDGRVVDRNGKATVYEYDELGNRSAVKYPNGNIMTYTCDACQRLKEEWVTDANGVTLAKYSYGLGKAGERLTITESDGTSETETTYQYDKLNRLVKETIAKDGNKLTNEYSYDKVSNRISKETKVKGELSALANTDSQEVQVEEGRTTYTYNALNQLVTEESPEGSITYTYDANGNLVKQSGSKTQSITAMIRKIICCVPLSSRATV